MRIDEVLSAKLESSLRDFINGSELNPGIEASDGWILILEEDWFDLTEGESRLVRDETLRNGVHGVEDEDFANSWDGGCENCGFMSIYHADIRHTRLSLNYVQLHDNDKLTTNRHVITALQYYVNEVS